jgi:hypothetical protein
MPSPPSPRGHPAPAVSSVPMHLMHLMRGLHRRGHDRTGGRGDGHHASIPRPIGEGRCRVEAPRPGSGMVKRGTASPRLSTTRPPTRRLDRIGRVRRPDRSRFGGPSLAPPMGSAGPRALDATANGSRPHRASGGRPAAPGRARDDRGRSSLSALQCFVPRCGPGARDLGGQPGRYESSAPGDRSSRFPSDRARTPIGRDDIMSSWRPFVGVGLVAREYGITRPNLTGGIFFRATYCGMAS